jgi:hypothetical protein
MRSIPIVAALLALAGVQTTVWGADFSSLSGSSFTTEMTSVADQYLMPEAPAGSTVSSYSVLSTADGFSDTATISFPTLTTSYTFLWGSPDSFNWVTDGLVTVNGSTFSSGNGNNNQSALYTFSDAAGFSSLTFSTTGIAFEVAAVSPVPEPETYLLLLSGLAAVGVFIGRRRQN